MIFDIVDSIVIVETVEKPVKKGAESNPLLKEKCISKRKGYCGHLNNYGGQEFGPDSYFSEDMKLLRPMSDKEKTDQEEKKSRMNSVPIKRTRASKSNPVRPTYKEIQDAFNAIIAYQEQKKAKKRNSIWGRIKRQLGVKESTRYIERIDEMLKSVENGVIPMEVQTRIALARWHKWQEMAEKVEEAETEQQSKYDEIARKKTWLRTFFGCPSFS